MALTWYYLRYLARSPARFHDFQKVGTSGRPLRQLPHMQRKSGSVGIGTRVLGLASGHQGSAPGVNECNRDFSPIETTALKRAASDNFMLADDPTQAPLH